MIRHDYRTAMERLLEHLKERGLTSVALISGAEENAWNVHTREAYSSWCRMHGLCPCIEVVDENLAADDVVKLGRSLLTGQGRPDSLIVGPSDYASIIASVAGTMGLTIPGDLMLASLIDTEHSRTSTPPLTALDLRQEELAAHAVELVFRLFAGEDPPSRPIVLHPQLQLRGSTRRR
ncbi:substrate-binding domain-containing protein [Mycobacteroides abscessus]|uniref:substrate-binding domain-containing protein n=1 Tax=Mycobacteroides abscessus TaxID=36809 RepID=UPI001A98C40B|nr:LacI family DNA-binding transcriptional regulator [Mycobacteroides abscessus]